MHPTMSTRRCKAIRSELVVALTWVVLLNLLACGPNDQSPGVVDSGHDAESLDSTSMVSPSEDGGDASDVGSEAGDASDGGSEGGDASDFSCVDKTNPDGSMATFPNGSTWACLDGCNGCWCQNGDTISTLIACAGYPRIGCTRVEGGLVCADSGAPDSAPVDGCLWGSSTYPSGATWTCTVLSGWPTGYQPPAGGHCNTCYCIQGHLAETFPCDQGDGGVSDR